MANPTELEIIANIQRAQHISTNLYNDTSGEYGSTHNNAISNGDEKGKGDPAGTGVAGGLTDIITRDALMSSNLYNQTNEYSATHNNAISNGDEKGKGDPAGTGIAGGITDIQTRDALTSSNRYGPNNEYQVII